MYLKLCLTVPEMWLPSGHPKGPSGMEWGHLGLHPLCHIVGCWHCEPVVPGHRPTLQPASSWLSTQLHIRITLVCCEKLLPEPHSQRFSFTWWGLGLRLMKTCLGDSIVHAQWTTTVRKVFPGEGRCPRSSKPKALRNSV